MAGDDLKLPVPAAERTYKDREAWKKMIDMVAARILKGLCR